MLRGQLSGDDLTKALSNLTGQGDAQRTAAAIDRAANGGLTGAGTDEKTIEELLKGKSKEEIKAIDQAYRQRTGISLEDEMRDEFSGSKLTKFLDLAKGNNDDAARLNASLEEHKEWGVDARSNSTVEKDIRDTLATLNSKQIAELEQTYQERYGKSLKDSLLQDKNLPEETKQALEIYLKGTDKRSPDDTLKLAELGLKSGNQDVFQEAFRDASPEARAKFLAEDGEARVKKAFGEDSDASRRAMDYVRDGKLDVATKVRDNSSWLGDNEEAIEQALGQMSDAERAKYLQGKRLADSKADVSSLNAADKEGLDYYQKLRTAMEGAGNERELARWEDLIKTGKEGSLVGQLAKHGGIFDDSMDSVLGTIEGMSKKDWERLKSDPEYRREIEKTLAIDLSDSEMQRARELLDKKSAAATFEESKSANRPLTEVLADRQGFFSDDEEGIIKALENMSPTEQAKYRNDPEYKKEIDRLVAGGMERGAELNAAMSILDRVSRGEKPESDIVSKLEMHSTNFNVDETKVVQDLEEAFRKDPTLRERLNNPQSEADKAMAKQFDSALRRALDPDEYEKYAKPLLETGRIPIEVKADLYKGIFNDDEKGFFESLKKDRATDADWQEVLNNPDKTLSFLSSEEREVALNIARQKGEMRPEDELRAAMVGVGTDEAKIKEILAGLKPEEKEAVRQAYENKYGASLKGDVLDELGGGEKMEAARALRGPQTAREAYNDARSEVYESADGLGRAWVDKVWDGTGHMTQDQLDQYSRITADYSRKYQELPASEREQFQKSLYESLELYKKSESAAADAVVDTAIIAAGVAGAKFTGGVSLSLLAYTSVGGALFKVGAKSALMGADYDFQSAQLVSDAATGAIDAATIVLGPAQAAQLLKLGERSAATAAHGVLSQADDLAKTAGRSLLKEGSSETLERELKEKVAVAIANGSDSIDDKAMNELAKRVAAQGEDIPQVQRLLTDELNKAIRIEASRELIAGGREVALNTASGIVGGALSGAVRGGIEGESVQAALTEGAVGALSGGAMAGGFSIAFKGLGKGLSSLRRDGSVIHAQGVEAELGTRLNSDGRVSEVVTPAGRAQIEYHQGGPLEGAVREARTPDGRVFKSEDGLNWKISDKDGTTDAKGLFKVDSDGNMTWQPEVGAKAVFGADGRISEFDHISGRKLEVAADGSVDAVSGIAGGAKFQYDQSGALKQVDFHDGRVLSSDAGKYKLTDKDGKVTELSGEVKLTTDGNIRVESAEGVMLISPEGGYTKFSPQGQAIEMHRPEGVYKYGYDADGKLNQVIKPDGSYHRVNEDGDWANFSPEGKEVGWGRDSYQVLPDGSYRVLSGDHAIYYAPDGTDRVLHVTENRLQSVVHLDGRREYFDRPDAKVFGRDGLEINKVKDQFKRLGITENENSIALVERELKDVRAIGPDGSPVSAYDSLMSDPRLSDRQKANIIQNLAVVREHFAQFRQGDRMHPDPEVNWIHTQGEMAKVLEVSRKAGLSADEVEDAVLASMYSDSVKFAFPPPAGVDANFFTHHIDGAIAAQHSLQRQGYAPERIDRILQAIKEHQIAPPEFMGQLYLNAKIKPGLDANLKAGKISQERYDELKKVLDEMTVVGPDKVPRLKPMVEVDSWPKVQNADGSWELKFTNDQKDLLRLAGIDSWSVPVNPIDAPGFKQLSRAEQENLLSRYKISTTLIDGDGVDNYATLGGASKIVAIRGPGTMFKDGNVWQSIASVDASFRDAYKVLSKEGREVADASLASRNALLHDEKNGIQAQMLEWLQTKGLKPEDVEYLKKDGALKYPEPLNAAQSARVTELENLLKAGDNGDPMVREAAATELRQLKYNGLSEAEITQFELAKEVRAKMTDLLRAGHRTGGDLPGEFPVARSLPRSDNAEELLKPRPFALPEATGPVTLLPDGATVAPFERGTITRRPDGSKVVLDTVRDTKFEYDPAGRIVEASHNGRVRKFGYDQDGRLQRFEDELGQKLSREGSGDAWSVEVKKADGTIEKKGLGIGAMVAEGDGSIRRVKSLSDGGSYTVEGLDGSVLEVKKGFSQYSHADIIHERKEIERLSRDAFPEAARKERFDKLVKEFEDAGLARDMNANQRAIFLKNINRLLEPNPTAVIGDAERANLAELALLHAVKPTTVDQGCNGTCNVTTLEVRNYMNEPQRNAKLLADIAIDGKFVTTSGAVIDLNKVGFGLSPDFEALHALKLQNEGKLDPASIKADGARDYSSQLLETAMLNTYWQGNKHIIVAGKKLDGGDFAYDSKGNILGPVDAKKPLEPVFDDKGNKLSTIGSAKRLYREDGIEYSADDLSRLVYTENGLVAGVSAPGSITEIFDKSGARLRTLDAGQPGYDKDGNQILYVARRGETKYEKVARNGYESEQVVFSWGDRSITLSDSKGKKLSGLSISELEDVNRVSSGSDATGYAIAYQKDGLDYRGAHGVKDEESLSNLLERLQNEKKLPAVLQVHTSQPPFSGLSGVRSAWSTEGGWHVVNIHSFDKETGMVRFSNQWGSRHDYLEEGVPLKTLFNAMQPTKASEIAENEIYKKIKKGAVVSALALGGAAGATGLFFVGKSIYDRYSSDEQARSR